MSRRRWMPLTLVGLLAFAGVPAVAQADRAPTRAERADIAKLLGTPARCLNIRVSTVNTRYASGSVRNAKRSCRRWQADGIAIVKDRGPLGWRFVTAGSAFSCPIPGVPNAVRRDLGIRCDV